MVSAANQRERVLTFPYAKGVLLPARHTRQPPRFFKSLFNIINEFTLTEFP
jgi:hypothetical protein